MHSPRARKHLCTPIPLHTTVHIHTYACNPILSLPTFTHTPVPQHPGAHTHMHMQVRLQPFARTYMRLPVLTHTHPHACTHLCIARTHRCNSTGLFTRANTRVQLHPCTPHVLAHSCVTASLVHPGAHTRATPSMHASTRTHTLVQPHHFVQSCAHSRVFCSDFPISPHVVS